MKPRSATSALVGLAVLAGAWCFLKPTRPASTPRVGDSSVANLDRSSVSPSVNLDDDSVSLLRSAPISIVRILDCDSIPDAKVQVEFTLDGAIIEAATDAAGKLENADTVVSRLTSAREVSVRVGGRLMVPARGDARTNSALDFRPAPKLRGRVVSRIDPGLVNEANIVAFPGSWSESAGRSLARSAVGPSAIRVERLPTGEFECCELALGAWTIVAIGPRSISAPQSVTITTDATARAELAMRPAAGVAIRLTDPAGGEPRLSSQTWALNTWTELFLSPELKAAGWQSLDGQAEFAVLGGMNGELLDLQRAEFVEIFAGDSILSPGATVMVKASAPGYERLSVSVPMRSLGELQSFESLPLARPPGESALEVRIHNMTECPVPTGTVLPMFRIELRNLDENRLESMQLVLDPALSSQLFVGLVPGTYSLRGKELATSLLPASSARTLTFLDGKTERLELDARQLGCVVLNPKDRAGEEYSGKLQVRVRGERTSRGTAFQLVSFRGRPYSLPFLTPGERQIELTSSPDALHARVRVDCRAGEAAIAEAVLEPR